jgi:hypothetical protein
MRATTEESPKLAQGDTEPNAVDTSPPNMYNTMRFYPSGWILG